MILCSSVGRLAFLYSLGLKSCAVTARACRCRVCEVYQIGQSLVDVSQSGPCFHNSEDFSWDDVIPLVSRSAGLSEVGQKFHLVFEVSWCISVMQWVTKVSSFSVLCNQYSIISLSVHRCRVGVKTYRAFLINLLSLAAMRAVINSSLGNDNCFSGASLLFAITKDTQSLSLMKATAP